MKKKIPIGIEYFDRFSQDDFYYVDKTGFIAELLHNLNGVNLFTRPRRFGKSLNMNMLKTFFEIGCNASLFDGMKISQEKELCEQYMGKYPVISITLKNVSGLTFEAACMQMKMVIGTEAERFAFLEESSRLSDNDRRKYRALIHLERGVYAMSDTVLENSLKTLCVLLEKHYGRKVILLIDEYDVPLDKAFQGGFYNEMVSLIRGLFGSALKTNDSLYFAVLTGCLRISKESIFTGLNNLNVMTMADQLFNDCFGFTEDEVREILAYYELEDAFETVRDWYDGYCFGGVSVYCPWDVMKYVQALRSDRHAFPENYWANTSGNALVRRFIGKADRQTRSEIERLVAGECIVKEVSQELTYNELDDSINNLWSVLFSTGYLTSRKRLSAKEHLLAIPNNEIRDLFVSQIQVWFKETSRTDPGKLERFCSSFLRGDAESIERELKGYLWNSISIRDVAVRNPLKENFYHGMLLGLLQYETEWEIQFNMESGEGYCDIVIETLDQIGVLIELKYAGDGDLEKGCADALAQIRQKNYDAVLRKDGMEKIFRYGIAFYKKNCRVEKN